MLLPRVAGAGACAASTLLAIGASTAPPSPAIVVVVEAAGVADTVRGRPTATTISARAPTVSAPTRTLDFTSSRLAGLSGPSRGDQAGVNRTWAPSAAPSATVNSLIPPASARSVRHASIAANASGGPLTSTSSTV